MNCCKFRRHGFVSINDLQLEVDPEKSISRKRSGRLVFFQKFPMEGPQRRLHYLMAV